MHSYAFMKMNSLNLFDANSYFYSTSFAATYSEFPYEHFSCLHKPACASQFSNRLLRLNTGMKFAQAESFD